MNVWREDELADWRNESNGLYAEGINIVPSIAAPFVAVAAVVLSALVVAVVARIRHLAALGLVTR